MRFFHKFPSNSEFARSFLLVLLCLKEKVNFCYNWTNSTLESGINIPLRLLIFWLFSRGYGLIPDSIKPILVVWGKDGANLFFLPIFPEATFIPDYSRRYVSKILGNLHLTQFLWWLVRFFNKLPFNSEFATSYVAKYLVAFDFCISLLCDLYEIFFTTFFVILENKWWNSMILVYGFHCNYKKELTQMCVW